MAFNLLLRLIANRVDEEDKDVGSPLDDVGDEIDGESDIDFDVEDKGHDELEMKLMVKVIIDFDVEDKGHDELEMKLMVKVIIDFDVEDKGHDELDLSLNSSDDDDSEIRSNPSDTSSAESEFAWFDHCKTLKLSYLPLELVSVWVNLS